MVASTRITGLVGDGVLDHGAVGVPIAVATCEDYPTMVRIIDGVGNRALARPVARPDVTSQGTAGDVAMAGYGLAQEQG